MRRRAGCIPFSVPDQAAIGCVQANSDAMIGAAPPPPSPFHVGDLDGSAAKAGSRWNVKVTIGIHTSTHAARAGAVVTGTWSSGGTAKCTTGTNGRCLVSKSKLPGATTSVTFTVTSVAWSGGTYVSSANHDTEGDSNGTTILIIKPA